MVNLLSSFFILKSKTGGARPARDHKLAIAGAKCEKINLKVGSSRTAGRHTFVHAATKVSKNAFLLAEGISSAGFLWHQQTTLIKKPARYRGASLSV